MGWEDALAEDDGLQGDNPYETGTTDFQDELLAEVAAGRGDRSLLEYQLDSYRTKAAMAGIAALMGVVGVISGIVMVVAGLMYGKLSLWAVVAPVGAGAGLGFGGSGLVRNLAARRDLKTKLAQLRQEKE